MTAAFVHIGRLPNGAMCSILNRLDEDGLHDVPICIITASTAITASIAAINSGGSGSVVGGVCEGGAGVGDGSTSCCASNRGACEMALAEELLFCHEKLEDTGRACLFEHRQFRHINTCRRTDSRFLAIPKTRRWSYIRGMAAYLCISDLWMCRSCYCALGKNERERTWNDNGI